MVVRTIEMLLEYVCIILCIYRKMKIDIRINLWIIMIFVFEGIGIWFFNMQKIPFAYKVLVFFFLLCYVKFYLKKSWKDTIIIFGTMVIAILFLQLIGFYILKIFNIDINIFRYSGILVNSICCLIISLFNERTINFLLRKFNIIRQEVVVILFILIFFRILYLCSKETTVDLEVGIQFLIETLAVCIACSLWVNAENEKILKKKEVQMYEMYNKAFEETIMTIRIRQHEFENHINAMKSLNYTIKDQKRLVLFQEEYCKQVLEGTAVNKLLKLKLNPVVIGFLYSKISNAEEKGVTVVLQIQTVNTVDKIEIYEFIEIVGILFDNALEALQDYDYKIIRLSLINEENSGFMLEVANISRLYRNEEMEMFWLDGYSSKGKNRGVGLARVKEIVTKNRGEIIVQNVMAEGENYISFKILFRK